MRTLVEQKVAEIGVIGDCVRGVRIYSGAYEQERTEIAMVFTNNDEHALDLATELKDFLQQRVDPN